MNEKSTNLCDLKYDEERGILHTALITCDPESIHEATPNSVSEERKRQVTSEKSTRQDKKGYKRCENASDQIPSNKEQRKAKHNKKSSSEEESTSEDEGDRLGYHGESVDTMSNPKSTKKEKRKEMPRGHVRGRSDNLREDMQYKHQRNKQLNIEGKEKEHTSHEVAYSREKNTRLSGSYAVQRRANSLVKSDGGMPDETVSNYACAENQGSIKHILILGTIGSGKYTIAKNISKIFCSFPTRNNSRESEIVQCIDDGDRFKFVLVNTGGARMPDVWGTKSPTVGTIAASIKQHLRGGISLIMVVVRYECITPEDLEILVNMINSLFTKEAKEHIALIHSGCEFLSNENVIQYMENFKADGPSGQLSSLCRKCSIATGFPNLHEAKSNMVQHFEQTIEESKRKLSDLVESCRFLQPYSKILKPTDDPSRAFPESKPDCSVM